MGGEAHLVVDERIRAELCASLASGPMLGGRDERRADSLAASVRIDIPAFQIANAIGYAAVDDGPNGELGEPERAAIVIDGKENFLRLVSVPGEEPVNRLSVTIEIVRPERGAHPQPLAGIGRSDRTDPAVYPAHPSV